MPTVPPRTISARERVIRFVAAGCAAALLGGASAAVRPLFRGPVHYEAVASLLIILPAGCLSLAWSQRRVPWRRAIGWFALEVLCVCAAFAFGWIAAGMSVFVDLIGVMAVSFAGLSVLGAALIVAWQRLYPPRAGPYCPACNYCLIGTTTNRCSECGRPFTVEELGIAAAALEPQDAT